jgi:uncharacterized membrane protein YcfT
MFVYFLIFTLLGFFIHKFFESDGEGAIVVIAIVWGISSGAIWGLASLGEIEI